MDLKRESSPQKKICNYSPSSCSKPVNLHYLQNINYDIYDEIRELSDLHRQQ